MQKAIAIVFASALGLSSIAADAMPIGTIGGTDNAVITKVAQGCGPGMHRGPHGACRRLFTCPPGWHTGPYGKVCVRNR